MPGRASRYVGGLSLTSLLAGLSTAPFAAYHFNQFANYGLVANLLAVPAMAFIIMPMGVMALLMMPFGLDGPFLSLMGLGIDHVMSVAFEISTWPRAVNHVSSWPPMALAFIVFGGLWLCLWKTPWRVAGVAATLIGFALGLQARPPDLVIDRDAGNIAVLAGDGDLIVMSKRARYAADSWSRRSGQGRTYEPPDEKFKCDILGCVYEEEGRPIVAYVSDGRAFEDECHEADILISDEPAPYGCAAPSLIVDLWDVYRNGAHAVWFEEDGYRVVTAAEVRGRRPWSKGPEPYKPKTTPEKIDNQ